MNHLRRLLFDSCRSNDAVAPPLLSFPARNFRRRSVPRRNPSAAVDFAADNLSLARETPAYLWRKEEKWHVVAYDDNENPFRRSKIDSHSVADDGLLFPSKFATRRKTKVCGSDWFSSDGEEEATMVSSSPESKKFAADAAGKAMRESMAVVKRSEDPRRDFRRSMVEMVVEKGLYDAEELEELLRCFLSLNSKHHHVAIVAAFADVWEALFSETFGDGR